MPTFTVPIEGSSVSNEGSVPLGETSAQPAQLPASGFVDGVYQPPAGRASLHRVRMGASIAKQVEQVEQPVAPVWQDNPGGQGGRFEYRPVERQSEPIQATSPPQQAAPVNDAISQQISQLTNAVTLLAQHQLGIEPNAGPLMPNPADFDFYDPQQEGEYHQALQKYCLLYTSPSPRDS